jgi:tRNA-uridine aminocarboxypropyltransferase
VVQQHTNYPVLLLQHSAEAFHPFTTSRFAAMGADNIVLLTGKAFSSSVCSSILQRYSAKRPCLLYMDHNYSNGEGSCADANSYTQWCLDEGTPNLRLLPENTDSLIVLDGTWRNTRELMLINAWLGILPVLGLVTAAQSEYVLRKTQHEAGLSTIEALGHVLYCTHSDFDLDVFLRPLRDLIEQQRQYLSH